MGPIDGEFSIADQRASRELKRKKDMSASSRRPSIWYGRIGRFLFGPLERFRVPVMSLEMVG